MSKQKPEKRLSPVRVGARGVSILKELHRRSFIPQTTLIEMALTELKSKAIARCEWGYGVKR